MPFTYPWRSQLVYMSATNKLRQGVKFAFRDLCAVREPYDQANAGGLTAVG